MKEQSPSLLEEQSFSRSGMAIPEEYADVNNALGLINHEKGNLHRAADFFKNALTLNPHYTEAALNLTITLNDLGQYDEARACINKAAAWVWAAPNNIDPFVLKKMAHAHAELGNQYATEGMWSEAVEAYQKALRICPDFVDVLTQLGIAFRAQGNDNEAIRCLARAEQLHPTYLQARLQLGLTYYMKGFLGLAFSEWETALKIDPHDKAAQAYMGRVLKKEEVED